MRCFSNKRRRNAVKVNFNDASIAGRWGFVKDGFKFHVLCFKSHVFTCLLVYLVLVYLFTYSRIFLFPGLLPQPLHPQIEIELLVSNLLFDLIFLLFVRN